jgi:competence protein ComEC
LPFWDRSIDALVITHPHVDHLGGMLEVIERFRTNLVLQPATTTTTSLVAEEWAKRLAADQRTVVHIQEGHTMDLGDGTVIEVLHPPARSLTGTEDDIDNNGVVLRVSYGEVDALLTADIRADAERLLVHRRPSQLQATVLKVAHHGSASSSTAQFLAAVTPSAAIVSAGADNRYGHPDAAVVRRLNESGANVLTTSECGTVELITDGRNLWLKNG